MVLKRKKHKCCMCGEIATWYRCKHLSGDSLYYCDECVPRNSTTNIQNIEDWGEPLRNLNVMWWDNKAYGKDFLKDGSMKRNPNSFYYVYTDKKGRRQVSENFMHSSKGFPKEEKIFNINTIQIMSAYSNNLNLLTKFEAKKIGTDITEILMDKEKYELRQEMPYNLFMSKLGDVFNKMKLTIAYKNNFDTFYKRFKKELSETKTN